MEKKQYKKPEVKIETFALNEYVAGDCSAGVVINTYGATNCSNPDDTVDWYYNTLGIFGSTCETSAANDDDDSYCYHTPVGTPVFSS